MKVEGPTLALADVDWRAALAVHESPEVMYVVARASAASLGAPASPPP